MTIKELIETHPDLFLQIVNLGAEVASHGHGGFTSIGDFYDAEMDVIMQQQRWEELSRELERES